MKIKGMLHQVTMLVFCVVISLAVFAFAQKEPPAARTAAAEVKMSEGGGAAAPVKGGVQQKVLAFNLEGFSEKGDKKWEIQGESAESMQDDRIKLKHIVAKSFGDEAEAVLKADKGIYDKTKNNVILEENVKVTVNNTAGMSNDYVNIPLVAGPAGGTGSARTSDSASPSVKSTVASPSGERGKRAGAKSHDKGTTTITCDGEVEFDYNANIVHFSKNVKVLSEDGEIDAEKITVFLDIKSKKIREVIAEGSVKITRGENITFSDKATYVEAEKKVILSGRPKLVFYQEGGINNQFFGGAEEENQKSKIKN